MPTLKYFVIGIGTNLGNKVENIIKSLSILSQHLSIHKISNVYVSPALLLPGMPRTWQKDYLNLAILITYNKHPRNLLSTLKQMEQRMGRDLDAPRFSPRVIDLDILISTCKYWEDDFLQIPHKNFFKRSFAYLPTQEVFQQFSQKEYSMMCNNANNEKSILKLDNLKFNQFKENLLLKKTIIHLQLHQNFLRGNQF